MTIPKVHEQICGSDNCKLSELAGDTLGGSDLDPSPKKGPERHLKG